jgi:hypothetical protein
MYPTSRYMSLPSLTIEWFIYKTLQKNYRKRSYNNVVFFEKLLHFIDEFLHYYIFLLELTLFELVGF